MVDGPAAYRYTNARLSQYGYTFFNPDYINKAVTSFVPNYDDKDIEPVTLPAQLPNVIINGSDGIGVGITTELPSFTPDSVIDVLVRLLKGERLQAIDFAKALKFNHKWGGHLVRSKENSANWMRMFKESETSVKFESELQIDRDKKRIVISDWPPGTNLQKFVERVRARPECQRCDNTKGSSTLTIQCKPAYNYAQFDKFAAFVQSATVKSSSFKLNVTRRIASINDGVVSFDTKFEAYSVPKLIMQWLRMRIELEVRSLDFRIGKQNAAIDYSKLLIFAADELDVIFKALKTKDPDAFLVKALKITDEQAKQILELKVRQLSKLDQDALKLKLKEQQQFLKQLEQWKAKPKTKVLLDLDDVKAMIAKDRSYKDDKAKQKLTVV
jgi:DNA gyrase/topoisomerase IV subunit A